MVQKVNFNNLTGDTLTVGNTTITGTGVTVDGAPLSGGGGSVSATTLTKSFTANEKSIITLSSNVAISPIVSVTKEVAPSDVTTKSSWDVNSTGSNYDLHNTAYDTTLQKGSGLGLTNQWDISTASFVQNFSVSSQEPFPTGVFFKPDGTKMYVIGLSNDYVNEYDLSTAWDISTASFVQNFSVELQESSSRGVFFKPDGTKMYVIGTSTDEVEEYDLSTAWDVSTASFVQSFSVASQQTNPNEIFFKPDGTKMYVIGTTGDDIDEYDLSTAWDISTASFVQNFGVGSQESSPHGMFFRPDGSKMYIVGASGDEVNEYDIGTPIQVDALILGTGSFEESDVGKIVKAGGGKATLTSRFGEYSESTTIPTATYTSGQWEMYGLDVDSSGGIGPSFVEVIDDAYQIQNNTSTLKYFSMSDITAFNSGSNLEIGDVASTIDGTTIYIAAFNGYIFEYTMSTPFDLDTISYTTAHDFTSTYTAWGTINLGDDDTKLYLGGNNGTVYQFDLSTSGDVSTASFNQSQSSLPYRAFRIIDDGTKAYGWNWSAETVYEYVLATQWDITSITSNGIVYTESTSNAENPRTIEFSKDGTLMFIGNQQGILYQYPVTTGYDLSTVDTVNVEPVSVGSASGGICWNDSGSMLFGVSYSSGGNIYSIQGGSPRNVIQSDYSSAITNQSGQISTLAWSDINSMTPDETSGNTNFYYAISTDNKESFKIVNATLGERTIARLNGSWEYNSNTTYASNTWTSATSNNVHVVIQESVENNSANRMDSAQLSAVGDDYHIVLNDTLDLAIIAYQSGNTVSYSDGVSINYTGKLQNKLAIPGTDYDYNVLSNTQIEFESLSAQNLKIKVLEI